MGGDEDSSVELIQYGILIAYLALQAGDELFFYIAYNQFNTEVRFLQVSKRSPFYNICYYKVNYYSFDWQLTFLLLQEPENVHDHKKVSIPMIFPEIPVPL